MFYRSLRRFYHNVTMKMNNVFNTRLFHLQNPWKYHKTAKVQVIWNDNTLVFVVYKINRLRLVLDFYQIPYGRYTLHTGSLPHLLKARPFFGVSGISKQIFLLTSKILLLTTLIYTFYINNDCYKVKCGGLYWH